MKTNYIEMLERLKSFYEAEEHYANQDKVIPAIDFLMQDLKKREELKLNFKKASWNHVEVIVEFEKDEDEVETVVWHFDLEELENEYFMELLKYLVSLGKTECKTWFGEFMYIPYKDGKPLKINEASVRKVIDGVIYYLDEKEIKY